MDDVIPTERANRDFRVKFPDDVMQENLAGQLWFGAEVSQLSSALVVKMSQLHCLVHCISRLLNNELYNLCQIKV